MADALTGTALVNKVKELKAKGATKGETARACGYTIIKANGKEGTNFSGFYEELLLAHGMINERRKRGSGEPGRPLSYRTKVLSNVGHVVVGARYLKQIGVEEGDVLQISINRGKITLAPIGSESAV